MGRSATRHLNQGYSSPIKRLSARFSPTRKLVLPAAEAQFPPRFQDPRLPGHRPTHRKHFATTPSSPKLHRNGSLYRQAKRGNSRDRHAQIFRHPAFRSRSGDNEIYVHGRYMAALRLSYLQVRLYRMSVAHEQLTSCITVWKRRPSILLSQHTRETTSYNCSLSSPPISLRYNPHARAGARTPELY